MTIPRRGFAPTLLTLGLALAAGGAPAHEGSGAETVQPVLRHALPEAPGKQATLVSVAYAPGQASAAHTHPGSVFAYVVEGSVVSQLGDEEPRTYSQGQSWYEPPAPGTWCPATPAIPSPPSCWCGWWAGKGRP